MRRRRRIGGPRAMFSPSAVAHALSSGVRSSLVLSLIEARSQPKEFVALWIADIQIILQLEYCLRIVQDRMPRLPLPNIQETEFCHVELVLEEAEVSVPMVSVQLGLLRYHEQRVVNFPVPLDVEIPELGAHRSALLMELSDHETKADKRCQEGACGNPSPGIHVTKVLRSAVSRTEACVLRRLGPFLVAERGLIQVVSAGPPVG